jgi:hypothetical protein
MEKDAQRVCMMTTIGLCAAVSDFQRHRGTGARQRYTYFLPVQGGIQVVVQRQQ